jgi:hypothetical protein
MNNPETIDKAVMIQGNRLPAPSLTVGLPAAGRWLSSAAPASSPYTQTLGNGQANVQVAKSPGTRGAGFAGNAAPNAPFAFTVHAGGRVAVLGNTPPSSSFGLGQKPYPAPSGNAGVGSPVSGSTYHIEGGGAAFINGLAAVSGDVVSWGKHYTPGQPLPGFSLRGNPQATTDIVDSPIVVGSGLTVSTTDNVSTLSLNASSTGAVQSLTQSSVSINSITGLSASLSGLTAVISFDFQTITYLTAATFDAENCTVQTATATQNVISSFSFSGITGGVVVSANSSNVTAVAAITASTTNYLRP